MADKKKSTILRPKVRFSQPAEASDAARAFPKARVKSIIDLKEPTIKILKNPPSDFDKSDDSRETDLRRSTGDCPNDLRLCPSKSATRSAPCLTEITLTPENHAVRTKDVYETKETSEKVVTKIAPSRSCLKEVNVETKHPSLDKVSRGLSSKGARKSCSSIPDGPKQLRKNENFVRSVLQTKLPSGRAGKENSCVIRESKDKVPAAPENTPRPRSIVEDKKSASTCRSNAATQEASTESKQASCKSKEVSIKTTKSRPQPLRKTAKEIGLMPCMKAAKGRSKSAPIKKTIVRDSSSTRTNAYVGPGNPRSRSPEAESQTRSKSRSRSEILLGDKLARPEYNSIVGTMKKLRDLREEKVVKDLEHLPAVYRGLVNGKVSSALDFGANEAIYRDLVDLTVDEKQLPSRLTRSKDPEPRQRDLVPKLSDFFVPTNDEEFRKAVLPRPPSPRVFDTWNPYKISDRMFAWKESLDHDL